MKSGRKKRYVTAILLWIVSLIFLLKVCIEVVPCIIKKEECYSSPYLYLYGILGIILFLIGFYLLEKNRQWAKKLCNYGVDALFLIITLTIFNKYVYPIIIEVLTKPYFYEIYRIIIFLSGISIIIILWYFRDKFKWKIPQERK